MFYKSIVSFTIFTFLISCFHFNVYSAPWLNMKLNYDGASHTYSAESVYIFINEKELKNLEMPPVIISGNTLVPAIEVVENIGAVIDWKKDTGNVMITYEDNIIIFRVGNIYGNLNGETVVLNTEPKVINNKLMIPVRLLSDFLKINVDWDNLKRTIKIDTTKTVNNENITLPSQADNIENKTDTNIENNFEVSQEEVNTEGYIKPVITFNSTVPDISGLLTYDFNPYFNYDANTKKILVLESNFEMSSENISINNDNINKICTINFPFSLKNIVSQGIYHVGDTYINDIAVKHSNKNTSIIFYEKQDISFNIVFGESMFVINMISQAEEKQYN